MVRFLVLFNWWGNPHQVIIEANTDEEAIEKSKKLDKSLEILQAIKLSATTTTSPNNVIYVDFQKKKKVAA